ncbi:MAG: peptide-methionine (S)-S-oxide reductase MsrA [Hyphomonadaceae bacterium]|nr:peptide-methionine (S)-S-oxide reductase MsrA [Hyphomonadaceae bacterium]
MGETKFLLSTYESHDLNCPLHLLCALSTIFLVGCGGAVTSREDRSTQAAVDAAVAPENRAIAIFAGGCFWCMEKPFDVVPGILSTTSGYSGGIVDNPSYESVTRGITGHYEVVQVEYDKTRVTYQQLLDIYWRQIDPFDARGQFCDKGQSYLAAIFPKTPEEAAAAQASKAAVERKFPGQTITVNILPAKRFWPAEDYHQDYYLKNPLQYGYYRTACGRDNRLRTIWGPPVR